jgi:hypothetical protein
MSDPRSQSAPVFRARTAAALVLVGVFAFSAFMTLSAYAPDLRNDLNCRETVYARCAVGFAGLAALAREDGSPVVVSRAPLPKGRTEGLLIATPEPLSDADVATLRFGGPTLVVLPKWRTAADPTHVTWGLKAGLLAPWLMPTRGVLADVTAVRRNGVSRPKLTGAAGTPLAGLVLTPGPIDSLQTLTAKGWTPVLTDETGRAVIARAPSSQIYVLSEPDLLNTQGLASLDTLSAAVAVIRGLRAGDGPLIFDATLNGYKQERSPLRLMFDPPFLAVTLCLAGALALAGLQAAFRFGPMRRPQRAFALGKEALADNSAQLIRLAGREAKMAPGYAALTRQAAARAVGAPRELSGEALTTFLDRLGHGRGLSDSLAAMIAEGTRVDSRAGLTALAARLYRWRLEMTRERQ